MTRVWILRLLIVGAIWVIISRLPEIEALTISLAFRGLGFWLPLLAGFILVHYVASFRKWRHPAHTAASIAGFALIMLARGLSRHKRIAWLLTLLVLGVSIVSHLVKGLDYEEAALAAALALWLLSLSGSFNAVSDPPSVTQGLIAIASAPDCPVARGKRRLADQRSRHGEAFLTGVV
ncbi:MAG: hypothetical protein ABFD96_17045 [Armatimonadia bacterium]